MMNVLGIAVGWVVERGLDYKTLEDLPDGSVVGTSSVRRVAQLRRAFPKLVFADMVRPIYAPGGALLKVLRIFY